VSPPGDRGDTRLFTGEPDSSDSLNAGESFDTGTPQLASEQVDLAPLLKLIRWILTTIPIGVFALAQAGWYARARESLEPNWVLGPLYFLANASSDDDWIGYALLAVAVPCLLSVLVRPGRWTALVASLTAWAWVLPGTVTALMDK
jgi:hypothetical protein